MWRLAALFALLLPQVVGATSCATVSFEGSAFTTCEVSAGEDLRLFHTGPSGRLGSFSAVNSALAAEGKTLGFAMNAGMYHPDRAPVGLFIDGGREQSAIVTAEGPGNFGLLPNGVFCIGDGFRLVESRAFAANPPACSYATQSGPMLVIGGQLHPRLIPDSDSTFIRNGVGVSVDGTRAVFVISDDRVNFHRFARFFRDALGLPDALYFDGKISRLYAPAIRRNDFGFAMGPIVGTVINRN
ncbi:MAG: phosphodiester glycosidase family protein [Pseudotabrizicola sp.]|uniref:phosphodiester glycosidase family protein n=1 Tax=Pseudotabrizicola sp. TaxID=2939647 RepID=UPI002723D339|nr:phosphodiester glycosidase family protein [Pseudotabrizicola sp.]MDO9638991.1 phosphodiester glycosidase family protein [Pseudotabrizicola sp.]